MQKTKPYIEYSRADPNGVLRLKWDKLDFPLPYFQASIGTLNKFLGGHFKENQCLYDSISVSVHEQGIILRTNLPYGYDNKQVAIPNDPQVLEFLKAVIADAEKIQKSLSEDTRVENIKAYKKWGILRPHDSEKRKDES